MTDIYDASMDEEHINNPLHEPPRYLEALEIPSILTFRTDIIRAFVKILGKGYGEPVGEPQYTRVYLLVIREKFVEGEHTL